jgi:hypothetical protein
MSVHTHRPMRPIRIDEAKVDPAAASTRAGEYRASVQTVPSDYINIGAKSLRKNCHRLDDMPAAE